MQEKDTKVDKVHVLEQAAEQLARLFMAQIEEINSFKNNNYESKIKK